MIWHGSLWRSRLYRFLCGLMGHPRRHFGSWGSFGRTWIYRCPCRNHTWERDDFGRGEWVEVPF